MSSTASLTHDGGGDSETIINMVSYAVENYGGDADRVYATGSSSGAMMTNVLAGAYPNAIKAGSVYSGVPDGCFYVAGATAGMATPAWNSQCADGDLIMTAEQWGDLTRSYYPGYTGNYPNMLMYVAPFPSRDTITPNAIILTSLIAGTVPSTPHSTMRTSPRRSCNGRTCST